MNAPIIAISRHRMVTDGEGVTTLVGFYGCPLRCKMCLNSVCFDPNIKRTLYTPQEIYDKLAVDSVYFIATDGGVTFGGGEPLLYPDFIREFADIAKGDWQINIETSLNVPWESVKTVAAVADSFIIDIKTADPDIYRAYTGKDNDAVMHNLKMLGDIFPKDKIKVRIPLIEGYNDKADMQKSKRILTELGFTSLDLFKYRKKEL